VTKHTDLVQKRTRVPAGSRPGANAALGQRLVCGVTRRAEDSLQCARVAGEIPTPAVTVALQHRDEIR
jgi:hypothetical protein